MQFYLNGIDAGEKEKGLMTLLSPHKTDKLPSHLGVTAYF